MNRIFGILFALVFPLVVHAQTEVASTCPEYSSAAGTEFRFSTDELYKKYGFQMFHSSPGSTTSITYEPLAGKRAKVVGGQPDQYNVAYYHEVLVEDCQKVYWYDTNSSLEPSDALAGGIVFLDQPPTKWEFVEATDPMTDARSCSVTPSSDMPYPMFYYHSTQGFSVGVVGGDFPGKPTTFRVDKNKAISEIEGLSGGRAQALVAQIRAGGRKLLISAYKWPYDYDVDGEFNLSGLTEKLEHCKSWVHK